MNYSLLFYPLAALLHPTTVVAGSCAGAAGAFAALLRRRWPALATGPSLAFALLVPLAVVAGTYPFLLGLAIALGTILALDAGHRFLALAGVLVTGLAHPLALAFLLVVLMAIALSTPGWWRSRGNVALAAGRGDRGRRAGGAAAGLLDRRRALPVRPQGRAGDRGLLRGGPAADPRAARPAPPAGVFIGYAMLGAVAFSLSSPLGGNAVRLMLLMGVPLLMLPLAARGFRPRGIAVALVAVALMWQALPAVAGWRTATESRAQDESFWYPVIAWVAEHHEENYRVQVVATADNWEAYYLARRGVPLARGWFRQDDFPANAVLYGTLTAHSYDSWLRRTGVHYVFLPDDPLDYSAVNEATLLRSGRVGPASGGPDRRLDRVRAPEADADRDPGRRHLDPLAHLGRRDAACHAARHLPAPAALHALLARGARLGLRRRRASRGARTCGSPAPASCGCRSTCASAPSWAPSSAARAGCGSPAVLRPAPRRGAAPAPRRPADRVRPGLTARPAAPTAGRPGSSRARCGSR